MKRAMIDPKICKTCNICEVDSQCPQNAVIREDKGDTPWVDFYKCRGCMKCKLFCNNGAVLEEIKPCDGKSSPSW